MPGFDVGPTYDSNEKKKNTRIFGGGTIEGRAFLLPYHAFSRALEILSLFLND